MKRDIRLIVNRIKSIAKEKKISMSSIARDIGMTQAGLHRSLELGSIKVSTLCDISDILEVEPFEFLIDLKKVSDKTTEEWGGMVEFQNKMIKEGLDDIEKLNRRLRKLEREIDKLSDKKPDEQVEKMKKRK